MTSNRFEDPRQRLTALEGPHPLEGERDAPISQMEVVTTCSLAYFCLQFGSFTLERIGFQSKVPISLLVGLAGVAIFAPVFFKGMARRPGDPNRLLVVTSLSFALLGAIALSTLWGPPNNYWAKLSLLSSMVFGLALAYPAFRAKPQEAVTVIAWWIFVVGSLFALAGLAASGDRVSVFGGGPNTYARVVGVAALAAIFLVQRGASNLLFLAIPLQLGALVASGSRGGLLGVLCGFLVLLVATWGRGLVPWRKILAGGLVIAAVSPVFLSQWVARLSDTWQTRYVRLTFEEQYVSGRDNLYAESLEFLGKHPLIGGGFGGFADFIGVDSYPHNLFLDVGVRLGVPGIVGLLVALLSAVRLRGLRAMNSSSVFSLSLAAAFFAASMASGWFFDSRFMWLALMMHAASIDHEARQFAQTVASGKGT